MLSVTKCGWGEVAKPHFDSTIQRDETLGTTTRWKKVHETPKHISASDVEFRQFILARSYREISKTLTLAP